MILSDVAVQELKLDFYMLVTYFINRMVDEPMHPSKTSCSSFSGRLTIQQWERNQVAREFHASSQTRCAARARERAHER